MRRNLIFISLLLVLLTSCASWSSRMSHEYMEQAMESNKQGDTYEALTKAVQAYRYDSTNEDAKKFITETLHTAMTSEADYLKNTNVSPDELEQFRENLRSLSNTQNYLKESNFIQTDVVNISDIKTTYENSLSDKLLSQIATALNNENPEIAAKQIGDYEKLDLPASPQFISQVNNLQEVLLNQGNFSIAIDFTKKNKSYFSDATLRETCAKLSEYAQNDENVNKKRALTTYLFLASVHKNNESIAKKIIQLRNDLFTMLAVLDLENDTDEFIPITSNDFAQSLKSGIDNQKTLTEVILKDNGLDDIRDQSINYDTFGKTPKSEFHFENNIRYLIVPKLVSLKISRQNPSMVTKNASWHFNSAGDAVAAAIAEVDAYGRYKVQYYQYDEYTQEVAGRMVLDVLVYDVKDRKTVWKERLESSKEDAVTWAENPMAVGIVNKIPATVYPREIQTLMDQKRPIMSDNELKKTLFDEMSAEIVAKVNHLIAASGRNIQGVRHSQAQ